MSRLNSFFLECLAVALVTMTLGLSNSFSGDTLNDEEEFGKCVFLNKTYNNLSITNLPQEEVLIALQVASSTDITTDPLVLLLRNVINQINQPVVEVEFAPYFTNFGFIRDPDNPAPFGLPIGIGKSVINDGALSFTCGGCHSGFLPSPPAPPETFKIGMPNTSLDLGKFAIAINMVLSTAGLATPLTPQAQTALASWGPGRVDDIVGKNDEGLNIPSNILNHWGDLDNWKFFEAGGETRDYLERNALVYFFIGVDPSFGNFILGLDEVESIAFALPPEDDMEALTNFLKKVEPPVNPNINEEAAKRGEKVFKEAGCRDCHNGPDHMNNDFIVPLSNIDRMPEEDHNFPNGSIATDPLRNCEGRVRDAIDDGCIIRISQILNPLIGKASGGTVLPKLTTSGIGFEVTDGYKVAPLSGVWATAPYLHNGSVPTLEDLLKPASQRPASFCMKDGQIMVGPTVTLGSCIGAGGFFFDTTADVSGLTAIAPSLPPLGNGNQGHEFGTNLTDAEKADLVEFVKSL